MREKIESFHSFLGMMDEMATIVEVELQDCDQVIEEYDNVEGLWADLESRLDAPADDYDSNYAISHLRSLAKLPETGRPKLSTATSGRFSRTPRLFSTNTPQSYAIQFLYQFLFIDSDVQVLIYSPRIWASFHLRMERCNLRGVILRLCCAEASIPWQNIFPGV